MNRLAARILAANDAILGHRDLDAVAEFFAEDYVAHATRTDVKGGHAAVRRIVRPLLRAFPDLAVEVEVLAAAKDRVAWRRTLRGTHRGTFKGFPATGRRLTWGDLVVSRFDGGLIAEEWVSTDLAEHLLRARRA